MKILHLLYDHVDNPWVGGGGAVRAYEIYRRLASKGHEITILSGNYPGASGYTDGDLRYIFVGRHNSYVASVFSYALSARAFLAKNYNGYDIIVEDFAPWNPVFSYKLQAIKPVVIQLHQKEGFNIIRRHYVLGVPFYWLENNYPKKFRNAVTISELFGRRFGLERAEVVPNGIDPGILVDDSRIAGEYCLYMGRIDYYHKGLDLLIKAFKGTSFNLKIIGKGKNIKRLCRDIAGLKNIEYEGFLTRGRKYELISNSKFVVVPSRYEGLPLAVLEVCARGKPLIVSDIDELDFVVKNRLGISFKNDNWRDLRKKVVYFWENDSLRQMFGRNAFEFSKRLTWDKIAEQYEKYLLGVYGGFYK